MTFIIDEKGRISHIIDDPDCPDHGQQVLAPEVNEATVRLLTRHDIEVVNVAGSGCCGSSVLHVGRNEQASALAKANIAAWLREIDGVDHIVMIRQYRHACGSYLWELPAGLLDIPGEPPRDAAERAAEDKRDRDAHKPDGE